MEYIVDRIEGNFAVLENPDGDMISIRLSEISDGIKEGDVLKNTGEKFILDIEATNLRKEKIKNLMNGMWK